MSPHFFLISFFIFETSSDCEESNVYHLKKYIFIRGVVHMPCGSCCSYVFMYMFCKINDHNVKFWHDFFVKMWFKVHRNVNDIREQIIAFIKKHIIILFTHKSIHNSDRKGIKYRMPYPRWSTSLVVNKQNKLCFFFKKIFWFPMFWFWWRKKK